jgi:hypothetical protein
VKLQHVNLFSGGFLNIWPKCVVAAAAATRPFKTELVGHWGESNLAAAHQTTAAVFEPQRKKEKNYIVASTRTSACSTEPWQTQPRTSKKRWGEFDSPFVISTVPQLLQKTTKRKLSTELMVRLFMIFIFRYDFKSRD